MICIDLFCCPTDFLVERSNDPELPGGAVFAPHSRTSWRPRPAALFASQPGLLQRVARQPEPSLEGLLDTPSDHPAAGVLRLRGRALLHHVVQRSLMSLPVANRHLRSSIGESYAISTGQDTNCRLAERTSEIVLTHYLRLPNPLATSARN